ncbi:aldose 1-epimerase [Lutimonas sp.]|uniref:aldose 1-epimerase n=1 Tax=Lutimonas sp. TaxID=1872403 RepID=UPI003D9B6C56
MTIDQISNKNPLLEHFHIHNNELSVKIYPNLGASLQELRVHKRDIIDGISNDQDGIEDYAVSYKSSILFPFPNRIEDGMYQYKGNNYQFPINEKPLNNALHGLVFNKSFKLKDKSVGQDGVSLSFSYTSTGQEYGFPFCFELIIIYDIKNTGDLTVTFEVENNGDTSFPMGMGWHPYFTATDLKTSELSFTSLEYYECNERNLPINTVKSGFEKSFEIEENSFDDACSLEHATCKFKTSEYQIELTFDYATGTYLQFYTPPHRKNIAIEPMTSIANSFNNKIGFKEIHSGESDRWAIHLNIHLL